MERTLEYSREKYRDILENARSLIPDNTSNLNDELIQHWDGKREMTLDAYLQSNLEVVQEFVREDKTGFKELGTKLGILYEMHEEMTRKGDGVGFFRLSGTLRIPPQLICALVMDPEMLNIMDPTVRTMNFFHQFNERTFLVYWQAAPGFPFKNRDGCDLTTWEVDEDGIYWQHSTGTVGICDSYPGCIAAMDKYWGYRLEPVEVGEETHTKLSLICQSDLHGWMPKFLVNRMEGRVLADYVSTVETYGRKMIEDGSANEFLEARAHETI